MKETDKTYIGEVKAFEIALERNIQKLPRKGMEVLTVYPISLNKPTEVLVKGYMNELATAQATSEGKTTIFHIALAIRLAKKLLHQEEYDGKEQSVFINVETNKYCSFEQALKQLDAYEKLGYDCVPPCDNIKADGSCAGHDKL